MRGSGERRWETACESAGDSQGLNAPTFDSTYLTLASQSLAGDRPTETQGEFLIPTSKAVQASREDAA